MKGYRFLFLVFLFFSHSSVLMCQQFFCPEIQETIERWNQICDTFKNSTDDWAKAIVANKEYRVNDRNQLEYDFIIHSVDTFDISVVKDLTINYICEAYGVNNVTRTTLVQGSTDRSIYFVGHYNVISYADIFLSRYYYDAESIFNIKFKENRIRITLTIPEFTFHAGQYEVTHQFFGLYPFVSNPKQDARVLNMGARCLINSISKTINHAFNYMNYLNNHYSVETTDSDW